MITPDDLAVAIGRDLTLAEEDQATYFINLVTMYVESYTGTKFSPVTETVRYRADYYGHIHLPDDTSDVDDVVYVDGGTVWNWTYDGMNEIFELRPNTVVDVTLTRGYDSVPDDIKYVSIESVKRLFLSPEGLDTGQVSTYTVGDVTETLEVPETETMAGGLFNDIEKLILDGYRRVNYSYHLGRRSDDATIVSLPPSSSTAIFE